MRLVLFRGFELVLILAVLMFAFLIAWYLKVDGPGMPPVAMMAIEVLLVGVWIMIHR
jgi:hypothetical protein